MSRKLVLMGAAGRDFHVFNCCYRDNPEFEVVAFTAAQIPHIEDRRYPAALAGSLYPDGIPIRPEDDLDEVLEGNDIDEVVFAYSDISLDYLEERRKKVAAKGIRFSVFDIDATMLPSSKPVIAITAVRTGCGKSQVSRRITHILRGLGKKMVAIRHPMPYGDLALQAVQRFENYEDLERHNCTIEEREEYEPHIKNGVVVYAGADYAAILEQAEQEADVIIWDGGNNDTPFYQPDLWIVVADPHRAGHELKYFPGTENFARAELILINKVGSAREQDIRVVEANAKMVNPSAIIVRR
ncbi:MAG: GTPase, partial [Gammaproteobacteria bacterium]|nr:GTPase [Gammaproteobacteria bacterium]